MRQCEIAIVGGGPAGLCAASEAASHGAGVVVLDRNNELGGQLVKQTHRFFGSRAQHAGTRGVDIAELLREAARGSSRIDLLTGSDVQGYYPDGVLAYNQADNWHKLKARKTIFCTGAAEKMLAFPGSDLPGVYGAGAVQTLMNVYGVRPGQRVLMIGAGNIGLIVSYQLLQAGVEVAAIVEALPHIGGYLVHASKVRRLGVPILTGHTISEALGDHCVAGAIVMQLRPDWTRVPGTEIEFECDTICLAVGLSPLVDFMWQAGCDMAWVPQLGGYVPVRDDNLETSVPGLYVAGDASGIEEASAAMMEGSLAGLACAHSLGYVDDDQYEQRRQELSGELGALRAGPTGTHILSGLQRLQEAEPVRQCLVEEGGESC